MKATALSAQQRARKFLDKENDAKMRKIPFTLTLSQWDELFELHPVCYYSGEPFKALSDITVERLDSRKGYEAGNVVLCNHLTNQTKSHLDAYEKSEVPVDVLVRMMRKSLYRLEKRQKNIKQLQKSKPNALAYVKTAMQKAKK